ncbi:efflux RND transporter permease subunit, partial
AITPQQIAQAIDAQNTVAPVGTITTADDRVFVRPTGAFKDVQALSDMLITVNKRTFRLGDIAKITRGYDDPPVTQMRTNGRAVLGIGVTMQKGGDVIDLGKALDATAGELQATLPAGLKLSAVSSMPHAVKHSVDEFVRSVGEAVAIVLVVSLVSLG